MFSLTVLFGLYPELWDRILLKEVDCNDPHPNYCVDVLIPSTNYAFICLILHLVRILGHLSSGAFWSFLPVWLKLTENEF